MATSTSVKNKSLKPTILLVEDDHSISSVIRYNLAKDGYQVIVADNGENGFELAISHQPDLIILDWMLPRSSGLEVCVMLRENEVTENIPIIMISARNQDLDKVTGLERGADDYITKPFSPLELMARIRAIFRRIRPAFTNKKLEFLDIVIDLSSYQTRRGDVEVKLAPIEFQILQSLMEEPGRVLSREELIKQVWETNVHVDNRTVDVHITRLRQALLKASNDSVDVIKTVRLVGYKLSA